jgi:hypothetical protein
MRRPFKMKGYTYPGKSPLRKDEAIAIPALPAKPLVVDSVDDIQKPSKSYEEASSEVKGEKKAAKQATRKANTKEFLGNLGQRAGEAIISAAISTGVNALTRSKKKKTRRSTGNGGFTSINFGRK